MNNHESNQEINEYWDGPERRSGIDRRRPIIIEKPAGINWLHLLAIILTTAGGLVGIYVSMSNQAIENRVNITRNWAEFERHQAGDNTRYEKMSADIREHKLDHERELLEIKSDIKEIWNKLNDRVMRSR